MDTTLRAYVWARALAWSLVRKDEAGEGVISTAMAVLIMAALGALMWSAFQGMWNQTSSRTSTQVNRIGN